MSGGMFAIQANGQLVEMTEQKYNSEDLLQGFLARYPSLLAGDQIDPAAPRRWALIRREAALPAEMGGADRWSVDHLFLDQDAAPTIIEVKRSTDTRIRREVVGQMLDYAANAVVYWPIERLRSMFDATHGEDAEQVMAALMGDALDPDPEKFWQQAKTNLEAGRVRMIFVSDLIPPELRRVVEFLNGQINPAQVLAVEIRQFVGEKLTTLVPRVIGQTAGAELRKLPGTPSIRLPWEKETFLQALSERKDPASAQVAKAILEWAEAHGLNLSPSKGLNAVSPVLDHEGRSYRTVVVWADGNVQIPFGHMRSGPFELEALRIELRDRLNAIPGVSIAEDSITKFPWVPLSVFADQARLKQLLAVLEWVVGQYRGSEG